MGFDTHQDVCRGLAHVPDLSTNKTRHKIKDSNFTLAFLQRQECFPQYSWCVTFSGLQTLQKLTDTHRKFLCKAFWDCRSSSDSSYNSDCCSTNLSLNPSHENRYALCEKHIKIVVKVTKLWPGYTSSKHLTSSPSRQPKVIILTSSINTIV